MLRILKSSGTQAEIIGYKLHKLAWAADRRIDQSMQEKFGVSQSQFLILYAAAEECQSTQTAVARFLNLTQAAVSRQIDNLVERGLITRQENSQNRRERLLTITQSGQETLAKVRGEAQVAYAEILADIMPSDVAVFEDVLEKLLSKVCLQAPTPAITKGGD